MKAAALALLGFVLAGCAPAVSATPPRTAVAPVSQWNDGSGERASSSESPSADDGASQAEQALMAARMSLMSASEQAALGGVSPDLVHATRIEMARQALVEDNSNKERVDVAEELERELAALQASDQTSKSRVRHATANKKQP